MKKYLHLIATDKINDPISLVFKNVMLVFSWIYLVCINFINYLYKIEIFKSYSLGKPVISVGNLTLGGVGKTPIVILIVRYLIGKGLKPVVLIRGYMDKSDCLSDEAIMLGKELQGAFVLVGKNRIQNAKKFLENKDNKGDVFILDDGFQHRKIKRDLDIVAIDSVNPFGNGNLIPRGILREPVSSLKRADVIVLTKTDSGFLNLNQIKNSIDEICENKDVFESVHYSKCFVDGKTSKVIDVSNIKGKSVCCLSSIGDPDSFERSLQALGADVQKKASFIDHYVYTEQDLKLIVEESKRQKINIIVTTAKDIVKIEKYIEIFTDIEFLYLKIEIKIVEKEEKFRERISSILHN